MSKDNALDPAVVALAETINKMRDADPVRSNGMMAQLEKLIGMMPRFPGHFLYIYNYSEGRIVYHQGFEEVLGYTADEVSIDLIYHTFHPDDAPVLAILTEKVIKALARIRNPKDLFGLTLMVDYRVRKKNGQYIKILRQTAVFEVDQASGKVVSTFSLCRDISSIKASNAIGWQLHGMEEAEIDLSSLAAYMPKLQYRPSAREMEVVRELAKGRSSKDIAATLNISVLTVATHRRNLLERTGTHNTPELVRQAMEQGWA